MGSLAGAITIVTGGASGLGAAMARLLAERGARVLVGDADHRRGHALAAELGDGVAYQHADVADGHQVAALVDAAVGRWGRLDGMVNNAGIAGAVGPIDATSASEWSWTLRVLLDSVFFGLTHAARVMKPARAGSIVSTSSIAGLTGRLGPRAYCAAKSAIIGLTRNVAAESGAYGIRVNAVAPGRIATAMVAALKTGDPADIAGAERALLRKSPLLDRPGRPGDVASVIAWLLSDDAGYVSGQKIVVHGGVTTGSPPAAEAGRQWFVAGERVGGGAGRREP
jgi:xanthoxin dehydrogenase